MTHGNDIDGSSNGPTAVAFSPSTSSLPARSPSALSTALSPGSSTPSAAGSLDVGSGGVGRARTERNKKACDACRARKVRCLYGPGEADKCLGCSFLSIKCTHDKPRRKRGPPNRAIQDFVTIRSASDRPEILSPPVEPPLNPNIHPAPRAHGWPSPSPPFPIAGTADPLDRLAPRELIWRVLDDWFEKVHPLAPVLHRRRFMHRLGADEAATNATFCALVASVCAATTACLRRGADYGPSMTPQRCLAFVDELGLLDRRSARAESYRYSLDWCIAMYNIGTTLGAVSSEMCSAALYGAMAQAVEGVRYLVYYGMAELGSADQQMLKRLFWLLFAGSNSEDMLGHLPFPSIYPQHKTALLRPLVLTDAQLDIGPDQLTTDQLPPWHGDTVSYVPGLNSLSDLFMVWHRAQATSSPTSNPSATLAAHLAAVQSVIDSLPPELRWRGGMSRPSGVTPGHDAQVANLFVTALHVRSNLLQKYPSPSDTHRDHHRRILDDLVEILYHVPRHGLEHNGRSVVPKLRDCGAAYAECMGDDGEGGVAAKEKLELLLRKLDDIDCWPGPTAGREDGGCGGG